LMLDPWRWGR